MEIILFVYKHNLDRFYELLQRIPARVVSY